MRNLANVLFVCLLAAGPRAQSQQELSKHKAAAETAVANGDWATAIQSLRVLTEANAKDAQSWMLLGYSLHSSGKLEEALKIHLKAAEFPQVAPTALYNVACVYALQGNKGAALDHLEKAAAAGLNLADHIESDSDMDSLRSEPRFKAVLEKISGNASQNSAVQVFAGTFDRKLTRIVLFGNKGSQGAVSISYGQPEWQAKYDTLIDDPKHQGRRWRFGKDEWTTLDASIDVSIGGTRLPAGVYYLTLTRTDGKLVLTALDPAAVHKHTIDPYLAHLTKGGIDIALEHGKVDAAADKLEIALTAKKGEPSHAELAIHFGPHRLGAPVELHTRGTGSK